MCRSRLLLLVLVIAAALVVLGGQGRAPSAPSASGSPAPLPSGACAPGDQDRYVYHPNRLVVRAACLRVTGTIVSMRAEPDGDIHVGLRVDAPYSGLVAPANRAGELVVEPICERVVSQADAVEGCVVDGDPVVIAGLAVGARVWMEGRYVLDTGHGSWAELHPLYRWGRAP